MRLICSWPRSYHLTADELDFVINYDIKYRMGQVDEEEDE